ncbi:MAG: diaminopimelate decarboxylase [Methanolinea sp.]|nr:diaminopimelate decarboxylase [Methanolinea sp.]
MKLPPHLAVRDGRLAIGGIDCEALAGRFGTPLYVTDQDRIVSLYRSFREALASRYPNVKVLYAAKANGNLAVLRALAREGAGADVFSSGELTLALMAGMRPEDLLFNGSSKSAADLALAVEKGVAVSLDSIDELHQLDRISREAGEVTRVAFRVNPALDVPTHRKIATGLATSKFGIPHAMVKDAYGEATACEGVEPVGIHCHIGSQILDVEPFAQAARVMAGIVRDLAGMGIRLEFVDLGGGLGIPYRRSQGEEAPTPGEYADAVVPPVRELSRELGTTLSLWVEPGRFLVADSTVLLTRVNSVKRAHKNFVNVDAGFNLLVRPAMYDAYHEVVVAGKAGAPGTEVYTVTGPICESGDILAEDRLLPRVAAGDLIAVLDAGAYGFAMSSQYNGRPRCAEVLVHRGEAALMRRAETIADLTATMVVPPWQKG